MSEPQYGRSHNNGQVYYDREVLGQHVWINFQIGSSSKRRKWYRGRIIKLQRIFESDWQTPFLSQETVEHVVHFEADGETHTYDLAEMERTGQLKWDQDGSPISNGSAVNPPEPVVSHHDAVTDRESGSVPPQQRQPEAAAVATTTLAVAQEPVAESPQPPPEKKRPRIQQVTQDEEEGNESISNYEGVGGGGEEEEEEEGDDDDDDEDYDGSKEAVEELDHHLEDDMMTDEEDFRKPAAASRSQPTKETPPREILQPANVPAVARAPVEEAAVRVVTPEKKSNKKRPYDDDYDDNTQNDSQTEAQEENAERKRQREFQEQIDAYICANQQDYPDHIDSGIFELWLRYVNKVTPTNTTRIMRQVNKFLSGEGTTYRHWPAGTFFYPGVQVTLATDLAQMMNEAKRYEKKYGRDLGNGWLLTHPIGKLQSFREYVRDKQASFKNASI